jgi:hypothetical protein
MLELVVLLLFDRDDVVPGWSAMRLSVIHLQSTLLSRGGSIYTVNPTD